MRASSISALVVVMWFAVAGLMASAAEAVPEAQALVRDTTAEVLMLLRENQDPAPASRVRLSALVAEKVLPHFDFEQMTRLAAGRNWNHLDDMQRALLVTEFRTLLVRTYSIALTGFQNQVIDYPATAPQSDSTRTVVRTRIRQDGATAISIDYRLSLKESSWKVYDILVDGISLVITYRSMFNSTIESSGADRLIDMLREKNAAVSNDAPA